MPIPQAGGRRHASTSRRRLMDELALLHATYRGRELPWLTPPRRHAAQARPTARLAARRTHFIQLGARPVRRRDGPGVPAAGRALHRALGDVIALFDEGEPTLIHGDTHSGNLFVDDGRTGFYDWAVVGRGARHARCRVLPVQLAADRGPPQPNEDALLARYRAALAGQRRGARRSAPPRPVPAVLGVLVDRRGVDRGDGLAVAADRDRTGGNGSDHDGAIEDLDAVGTARGPALAPGEVRRVLGPHADPDEVGRDHRQPRQPSDQRHRQPPAGRRSAPAGSAPPADGAAPVAPPG